MAKQVFISSNTIQLTAEEAYPSFAGKGITFVVLDDINYQHSFYYIEYKDGDNYTTHRFTNDEISSNTFTWTDTRAVPDTTSLRFYIVSGPKTVYTTEYLELEKPHDPYEKALVYRGVPTAVAPTLEEAAAIYSRYDMVVFLEGYEDPSGPHYHEVEELIKLIDIDTRVVGRVYIGTLTMAYVKAKILRWKVIGAIGVVLDEIIITRAEQNELIDYAHSLGLFVLATGRDYDNIFAKDANNVTSKLTYGDYFVFETAFSDDIPGIQSPSNVDRMYKFWHTTNIWGKTYPEYYHVKTLQVDILPDQASVNFSKKCQAFSLVGAAVFHNSAVAIGKSDNSIVDWDYSAIDFYSKDVPEVEVKSKTAGSTTFNYSWSAEINGNLHEVTFNAAGPDDRIYSEATHYMKYNDRHMVDVWASVYDHEKRIQDLEAGGESTQVQADYAETDPTKVSYIKNKPTIGDATITITQAGVTKGTFTVNTTVSSTIALDMSTQEQANWTESSTTSPAYIKNKPSLAVVAISGSYTDLTNKPSIPTVNDPAIIITQGGVTKGRFTLNQSTTGTIEVDAPIEQVQSDWNESTTTSKAYIKNKPSIPAAQIQSDWAQSTTTEVDYIKNKPTIPTVNDPTVTIMQGSVTKGSFSLNQASTTTITVDAPVEQVQSDWNESTTTSKAYIQNKPTIPTVYDSTITIKQGSVTKGSFTLNQATPSTITLDMSSAQEQADWAESSTTAPSYIKNKPTIPSTADCEKITNKSTSWSATPDNTHYPSEKLVKDSLDAKGDLTIQWHETVTDAYYPSEKLVKDELDAKGTKIGTWGTTPTNNQYPGAYLVKTSLDNKVDKSSTSTQSISCSGSSVPVRFYGSSTNDANYIGIGGPMGNNGGYFGVSSTKKPLYGNGTTVTEISLVGHTHAGSEITSGTLDINRIPNLTADKITSGTFSTSRIPSLDASKITSGTFDLARIPTIPSTKTSGFADVATSGSYNDLSDKPTIPAAQIQSDWNQSTTTALDYIKNRPAILIGTGVGAIVENYSGNIAAGEDSHAEGYGTNVTSDGTCSHAEGYQTTVSGYSSHAEGYGTVASGIAAHAEGQLSTASGHYSHAEGQLSTASGNFSHAGGKSVTLSGTTYTPLAQGQASFAHGAGPQATGNQSFAIGQVTTASGAMSFSGGNLSDASGRASFAYGNFAQVTRPSQFAIGYGNAPQADSIFEVGNGLNASGQPNNTGNTAPATRQNAFRVTQGGVAVAQTAIQIGNTLIDESHIQSDWNQSTTTSPDYIKNKPTSLSQFTDDLGSSPTHTHSQYATTATVNALSGRVSTVEGKIPSAASTTNQLADKSFVNSSIATETAHFLGTNSTATTEAEFLTWANALANKTNNDYTFWSHTVSSNPVYDRYKYSSSTSSWSFEYRLNNSSFTAVQWNAINSGITGTKVSGYDTHVSSTANPHGVTASQVGAYTTTQTDTLLAGKANTSGTYSNLHVGGADIAYGLREGGSNEEIYFEMNQGAAGDDMFDLLSSSGYARIERAKGIDTGIHWTMEESTGDLVFTYH